MQQSEYYKKKREVTRYHDDLDNLNGVKIYFRNHAIASLHSNIHWSGVLRSIDDWVWEHSGKRGRLKMAKHMSKGDFSI